MLISLENEVLAVQGLH